MGAARWIFPLLHHPNLLSTMNHHHVFRGSVDEIAATIYSNRQPSSLVFFSWHHDGPSLWLRKKKKLPIRAENAFQQDHTVESSQIMPGQQPRAFVGAVTFLGSRDDQLSTNCGRC
mmetsp:Transcript_1835/g.3885  ORF Transcript_1835/g.3885 Transcript_1835/m.3885 type:complete len:116 (-) Transcript_1835:2-349(-)